MKPFAPHEAWALLSPEERSEVDLPRWMHAARTFLDAELSAIAATSEAPEGEFCLGVAQAKKVAMVTTVRVRTFTREEAPEVIAAAEAGARAIGGAGMDALVARARRVWQLRVAEAGDPRAALVLAATLASVMLAPVVPPEEVTVFGVRGARLRLERLRWGAHG